MKAKDYIVFKNTSLDGLIETISAHIKTDYWQPIGGIFVESGSFVTLYYQAMILVETN